jgi:hypothetical protein
MTNNSHANDLTLETATELGRPVYVAINRGTSMKTLDKGCQVEEITFDGNGTINGVEFTEQGSYFALIKPDGSIHSHGSVAIMTAEGESATYTYQTLGMVRSDGNLVERGCAFVSTTSNGKLASLDKVMLILRTEIDPQTGTGKTWGWDLIGL